MTDTMLFGILKMPFEMAMKDEISRLQYYARVQELVGRFEAQQQAEPGQMPNDMAQQMADVRHLERFKPRLKFTRAIEAAHNIKEQP